MAIHLRAPCDEPQIRSKAAAAPCEQGAEAWVLAATILGSSMAFIDNTVVNVALPALQADLRASVVDVQWVVQAYTLLLAALLLVGGSLGDHYGRRLMFGTGVGLFALASVWCGLAPNAGQLIAARALQGIGGALLVPGSLAIISASFDEDRRGKAIGTWSGFTGITTAIGPVLGGWLVENVSWRWIFFINVPIAVVVLQILFWRVPESRDEEEARQPLDWLAALLVVVGLGGIVYGLTESGALGLAHPLVLGALAVGLTGLGLFVLREARAEAPMMPLDLFRSRTFSGANLLTLLLYAALGGAFFYVPFNLIQVQGYSATAAGAAMLPLIAIMFLLSRWAGGLVQAYGPKPPLVVGPIVAATGFALFARPGIGESYWTTFFPAIVVLGVGMATSVAPLTTTVMGAVEQRHSGLASGINNAVSRTAGLLAIALLSLVIVAAFNGGLDERLAGIQLPAETRAEFEMERTKLAGADVPAGLEGDTRAALERAIDEAYVGGFRLVMLVSAGLALAAALSAWLLIDSEEAGARGRRSGTRGGRSSGP
jgi:EmrB/QacA subfamily drug resistance transporter